MSRWEILRNKLVVAFDEVSRALQECKNEDDLRLVLDLADKYPALARTDLETPGVLSRRVDAMRAAVDTMRNAIDPIDPLRKKSGR